MGEHFRDARRKHGSAPSIDPARKPSRIYHPGANCAESLCTPILLGYVQFCSLRLQML